MRKDRVRATRRNLVLCGVLLTGPIILGLEKLLFAGAPISHRAIVTSILCFPLGWLMVMSACQIVAMKAFVQFMRLTVWDSVLFDSFYGHDIISWTAFAAYYGTFLVLSMSYGAWTVVSTVSLLGIQVAVAAFLGPLGTFGLTRFVFPIVLFSTRTGHRRRLS